MLTAKDASSWQDRLGPALRARTTVLQKPAAIADLAAAHRPPARRPRNGGEVKSGELRLPPRPTPSGSAVLPKNVAASSRFWEIERQVEQLRKASKASRAFLLALRPGPIFTLIAGSFPELRREVQQSLEVSPVGDLIRERGLVLLPDIGPRLSLVPPLARRGAARLLRRRLAAARGPGPLRPLPDRRDRRPARDQRGQARRPPPASCRTC